MLFEKMKKVMDLDKAKHHILPPTKFGLVQITRERVRPEMNIDTMEKCPMCSGNGKIDSSLLLIDQIATKISGLTKIKYGSIHIATHPFVASHINKGWFFNSIRHKWEKRFNRKIIISADERLHLLQYSVMKG